MTTGRRLPERHRRGLEIGDIVREVEVRVAGGRFTYWDIDEVEREDAA